jgi:uroporphyrinogen-III decarboxylase
MDKSQEAYRRREQRINDAVSLKKPDRVPVMPLNCLYYATRAVGISNKIAQQDYTKRLELLRKITNDLDLDAAPPFINLTPTIFFELMGVTDFKWPGGDLDDNMPNQYIEKEYLGAEEYEEYLSDPTTFTWKKLWPRFSNTMALVQDVQLPLIPSITTGWFLGQTLGMMLSQSSVAAFLQKMMALGSESAKYMDQVFTHIVQLESAGFPVSWIAGVFPAFDTVSHDLRGLKGTVKDMYRQPDKLSALLDFLTQLTIQQARLYVQAYNAKRMLIPILRGVDGFLSDEQFIRFYWTGFKAVVDAMLDDGVTPLVWFEADCTSRLKYFTEFPKGRLLAHFDIVDRRKTKKLIDGRMCFWGNVPSSLLIAGTPKQVEDDVKEIIDIFGDGGLIIDGAVGIPDEARPENVYAMVETAHKYGVY